MATYNALAAVSRALLGLIEEHCPSALLINPEFKLYHAPDFDRPMSEGFSLFLYRVSINASVRNLPPRRTADGRRPGRRSAPATASVPAAPAMSAPARWCAS